MTADAHELRARLRSQLNEAIEWMDAADPAREQFASEEIEVLEQLRGRAASVLLKIAMVGSFSSGKSFLANGLQEALVYKELEAEGEKRHKYVGLLPSLPAHTTSVPTTLVPVSDRPGYKDDLKADLKVRFDGEDSWTDIGVSTVGRIAAYTTDHETLIVRRKPAHMTASVVEAQLDLGSPAISAMIFDLPGTNAVDLTHDEVVKQRISEADCFLYVTMATSALSNSDLSLVRYIFEHHLQFGKPVIWVTTGIDRAQQVGFDNQQAWKSTVAQNNAYLERIFDELEAGRYSKSFLGQGFIGVSPAYEAQARERSTMDPEAGKRLQTRSGMNLLRTELDNLIAGESGNGHIHRIALEAVNALSGPLGHLSVELESQRLPQVQLQAELASSMQEIDSAKDRIAGLQQELKDVLAVRLERVKLLFEQGAGLRGHLRAQLTDHIERTDFTDDEDVNRYELALQETIRSWLAADGNPDQFWRAEFADFKEYANQQLNLLVGEDLVGTKSTINLNDVDQVLTVKTAQAPDPATSQSILKFANEVSPIAAAGLSAAGISAVGIATAGAVSAFAAAPTAAVLGLAAFVTLKRQKRERHTVLSVLRDEERERLGSLPDEVADWFMAQVSASSYTVFDAVGERTSHWLKDLVDRQESLRKRADAPDSRASKELIEYLGGRHAAGSAVRDELVEIAELAGRNARAR